MPDSSDETLRQLARLGMTTRQIADQTHLSQSTVVRRLQRINTGPDPVLTDDGALLSWDRDTEPHQALRDTGPQDRLRVSGPQLRITDPSWFDAQWPGTVPPPEPRPPRNSFVAPAICLLAAAVSLAAAVVLYFAWKTERPVVYIPKGPVPITVCEHYTGAHHYLSEITIIPSGNCPPGWITDHGESG